MSTSICSCASPVIVQDTFNGCDQAVCQSCGQIASKDEVQFETSMVGTVHVGDEKRYTRHFRIFLSKLDNFAGVQGLARDLKQQLFLLAESVWECCKGKRNKDDFAVACLVDILEANKIEYKLQDLCKKFKVKRASVVKAYKNISGRQRSLENNEVVARIESIAIWFDEKMVQNHDAESQLTNITSFATKLYDLLEPTLKYTSRNPKLIASAICIMVCRHLSPSNVPSVNETADCLGFNPATLSQLYSKISGSLFKMAGDIPWKPAHMTRNRIHYFLNNILEYCLPTSDRNEQSNDDDDVVDPSTVKTKKVNDALTRISKRMKQIVPESQLGLRGKEQASLMGTTPSSASMEANHENGNKYIDRSKLHRCKKRKTKVSPGSSLSSSKICRFSASEENAISSLNGEQTEGDLKVDLIESKECEPIVTEYNVATGTDADNSPSTSEEAIRKIDGEDLLIEELLVKGCSVKELLTKKYHEINPIYFDNPDANDGSDDISDSEIDSYCLAPQEVVVKAKKLQNFYLEGL